MTRAPSALVILALLLSSCIDPAAGLTLTVERNGVRLRMEVDRAEIRPGDLVWVTLTIDNTTDRDVTWVAGGCKVPGLVEGTTRPDDAGKHWPGVLGVFKQWLLKDVRTYVSFADEETWSARSVGGRACPAMIFVETLPAKATIRSRWVWDGKDRGALAIRPAATGPVDVSGSIAIGDTTTASPLKVTAQLRIRDGGDGVISAAAAVDKAYEDGRLARWLEARPAASTFATPLPPSATFAGDIVGSVRLDGDTWVIHAAQKSGSAAIGGVIKGYEIDVRVAGRDGKVLSVVER